MSRAALTMSLVSAAALIIVSCGGDNGTGPGGPSGDDWFPLSVGNIWQSAIDGYVLFFGDTTEIDGSMDREVMQLLSHQQGFDVYEFRTISSMTFYPDTGVSYTVTETTFVYLYEDSTEIRGYDDTVTTDYELIAMLPLEVGDTWYPYQDSAYVREVMSLSASVTVPAGSFSDCAHIEETDSTQSQYSYNFYLHRGVGIVKDVIDDQISGADSHVEIDLESYTVN